MKFSVIVPAYNAECYLRECLDSIVWQNFTDYEVIIVDDGSVDATSSIADNVAHGRDNWSVLHNSNEGLLMARRRGLLCAKGEYVLFIDADDALRSDALTVIATAIDETQADIVSFRYSRNPDFKHAYFTHEILEPGFYDGETYEHIKAYVCLGSFNSLCGKALRKNCIDVNANYESFKGLMHGEDLFQLLPIIDSCSSLLALEDILYFYRPNAASSTATFNLTQLSDLSQVDSRLVGYATKWGPNYLKYAAQGELSLYIGCLKTSELSDVTSVEKKNNFKAICEAVRKQNVFERSEMLKLRIDRRLLRLSLKIRSRGLARLTIDLVEMIKRIRNSNSDTKLR